MIIDLNNHFIIKDKYDSFYYIGYNNLISFYVFCFYYNGISIRLYISFITHLIYLENGKNHIRRDINKKKCLNFYNCLKEYVNRIK